MTCKLVCLVLLSAGMAMGQATTAPTLAAKPAKAMEFDVVSIREDPAALTQRRNGPPQFGPTGDGYRMMGGPLILPIITAYIPQTGAAAFMPDQIKNLPDWVMRDAYDIDAKVSEEDMAEWQKPASQKTMLPAMMQSLLEDRFKLAVHREIKDDPVYLLTVAKVARSSRRAIPPSSTRTEPSCRGAGFWFNPKGAPTLYDTSMASLATLLGSLGETGRRTPDPGQDRADRTVRHHDQTARYGPPPPVTGRCGRRGDSDPASMLFTLVEGLGLKLESGKQPVETLVIDHIEKPSAN